VHHARFAGGAPSCQSLFRFMHTDVVVSGGAVIGMGAVQSSPGQPLRTPHTNHGALLVIG
tara:strand:+ start:287 stop:466 length:180 start_codon:yes stop_codon:yes gene_type:complete